MIARLTGPTNLPVPSENRQKVRIHHDFDRKRVVLLLAGTRGPIKIAYLCYDLCSRGTSAHITLLAVYKPYRGQGFSKLLLNNALTHMFFAGIEIVTIFCYGLDEDVQSARLAEMYRCYGFAPSKEEEEQHASSGPDKYKTPLYTNLSGT